MDLICITVTIGLSAGFLIAAWRDGSLFATTIGWLEDDMLVKLLSKRGHLGEWFGQKLTELLLCPFCLCPWVSFVLWVIALLGSHEAVSLTNCVLGLFASSALAWVYYQKLSNL
jgi:hypothetical protein